MDEFRKEVHALSTKDLILIIEDQKDLYSAEEFAILQEELSSRPENALELEERAEEEQRIAIEKEEERKDSDYYPDKNDLENEEEEDKDKDNNMENKMDIE